MSADFEFACILTPRDGLFCKDGRGWSTRALGRAGATGWPPAATLRGALRNAFGRVQGENGWSGQEWMTRTEKLGLVAVQLLRRPLDVSTYTTEHRLWPVPVDAVFKKPLTEVEQGAPAKEIMLRLRPHPLAVGSVTYGWSDAKDCDRAREALWHPRLDVNDDARQRKDAPRPDLWKEADFVSWLVTPNGVPLPAPLKPGEKKMPGLVDLRRFQIQVQIDPVTQSSADRALFNVPVQEALERDHEWAMAVFGRGVPKSQRTQLETSTVLVGGRRRPTQATTLAPDKAAAFFELPKDLKTAAKNYRSRFLRLVLVTPGEFDEGWLPGGFAVRDRNGTPVFIGRPIKDGPELILRAALVPRALPLATFDMARIPDKDKKETAYRPRPTRRLVPAGAVYFVEKHGGDFTADEIADLWMNRFETGFVDEEGRPDQRDMTAQAEGLGRVVPGLWTHE